MLIRAYKLAFVKIEVCEQVSKLPVLGVIELHCSVSEISVRNLLNYYEEGGMLTISTVT